MDDLQPGRELDALIAEKVMGQQRVGDCPLGDDCGGKYAPQVGRWPCLPPYSTDIAAAMELAKLVGATFELSFVKPTGNYHMRFILGDAVFSASSKEAAHAICLAALKAVS